MAKTQTFDVHVCRQARWTIDANFDNQREAEEFARKLFAKMDVEGVRVVVDVAKDGKHKEAPPVFEQLKNAGKNLTTDSFVAGLEAIKDYHDIFNGPPVTFGPNIRQGANSSFLAEVKGGKWTRVTQPLGF